MDLGASFSGSSSATSTQASPFVLTDYSSPQGGALTSSKPNWTLILVAGFAALGLVALILLLKGK